MNFESKDSISSDYCRNLHAPKKMKLTTTTYQYNSRLFKDQQNSDISIMILGKLWKLHKIYLAQSPYFYSIFYGSWQETGQNFVEIEINDSNITHDALEAVFGSMYFAEIEICPRTVVSIFATAAYFQLQGIIDKCVELMIETTGAETAIDYYEAACHYSIVVVKKSAFEWLETNFVCIPSHNLKLLKQISVDLMSDLVSSPDMYVMEMEFQLYSVLRTWIYLRLHPNYSVQEEKVSSLIDGDGDGTIDIMQTYFRSRTHELSFLETTDGKPFVKPFLALRTQFLINHHMGLKIVYADNIIPKQWLEKHMSKHFQCILVLEQSPEYGPQNLEEDVFLKNCMRWGCKRQDSWHKQWYLNGFNFGLGLVLAADMQLLSIRRSDDSRLRSMQEKRQFMIRVSVSSINAQRQRIFTQKSKILSLSLKKGEIYDLMIIDKKVIHPQLISVNLLLSHCENF